MMKDPLGDRCKRFERMEAGRVLMPGLHILVRLDGRAFHTYTRGLRRPFDGRLSACMAETTGALVEHFHADVGYTQSDEITLLFRPAPQPLFGGRVAKLTSVLAGFASATFYKASLKHLPEKASALPHFDARAWCVPNREEAVAVFAWREADAVRCSLNMLAQAHFSSSALHGKKSADLHDMLHEIGVHWGDLSESQKRGSYYRRAVVERPLTDEERARIPQRYWPQMVRRSSVVRLELPPIGSLPNAAEILFGEVEP